MGRRRVAARILRTTQDKATAFKMGDQSFSDQPGHQLVRIMHPAASVMAKCVHKGIGDVVCTGRTQAGRVWRALHQKTPCRNHTDRPLAGPVPS